MINQRTVSALKQTTQCSEWPKLNQRSQGWHHLGGLNTQQYTTDKMICQPETSLKCHRISHGRIIFFFGSHANQPFSFGT